MPACCFCLSRAETTEGVWPPWLLDRLAIDADQAPPKCVCATCVDGWLKRLERRARPVIEARLAAPDLVLDTGERETLTRWALKGAMIRDACSPEAEWFYNREERKRLRKGDPLPSGTRLELESRAETRGVAHAVMIDHGEGNGRALITTLTIATIVVRVISTTAATADVSHAALRQSQR